MPTNHNNRLNIEPSPATNERAMALPDQLEISAVLKLEADPLARNIFIDNDWFILIHIYS